MPFFDRCIDTIDSWRYR